jgi:hypothetical protein
MFLAPSLVLMVCLFVCCALEFTSLKNKISKRIHFGINGVICIVIFGYTQWVAYDTRDLGMSWSTGLNIFVGRGVALPWTRSETFGCSTPMELRSPPSQKLGGKTKGASLEFFHPLFISQIFQMEYGIFVLLYQRAH